jgi:tetratricopeptide (TPR) repeat protein
MWDRSIEQNAKAMAQDDVYRELSPEQFIQHMYMTHNSHMLAFSAMMVGREKEALHAAREQWNDLEERDLEAAAPFFDPWMCSRYDVLKRFGRWDELLAEPGPPEFLPVTKAVWHAHRAIAYAAKKDFENARREHEAFRQVKDAVPEGPIPDIYETTMDFLAVSDLFIEGEIALQQDEWNEAARLLEEAAEIEDELGYGEPPMWLQPVRHTLGAVYLKAGKPAEAERVYRDDLAKWRDNGWSLYGLGRALELQGKIQEAGEVQRRFEAVWADADNPIVTSCLCIPKT